MRTLNIHPSTLVLFSVEQSYSSHLEGPPLADAQRWEWLVATVGEPEGDEQCECDQSIASHKGRAGSDWLMLSRTNNNTSQKLSYSISSSERLNTKVQRTDCWTPTAWYRHAVNEIKVSKRLTILNSSQLNGIRTRLLVLKTSHI